MGEHREPIKFRPAERFVKAVMDRRLVLGLTLAALMIFAAPKEIAVGAETPDAANSLHLSCSGRLAFGRTFRSSEAQPSLEFEISVRFGEGEILALVDPETSKVETALCDAEVTSGSLRIKSGDLLPIVWTRLSGATGPFIGEAIASDGDVLALSVEGQEAGGQGRPFALFAAADASAYRGVCKERQSTR